MHKFVLLLTCVVGLAAAGVLDVRTLSGPLQPAMQGDTQDMLARMSRIDLERQKFVLEVLQRVQDEPQNEQIIRLGQLGLIEDSARYVNGIDGEMQRIIELARQGRLLSRQQQYTSMSKEQVRQMSGIYRLLVNAADWDTLQRNIAALRLNSNGVLLVNALVLALRDREDTQLLIIPAVPEILPALYVDADVARRAQNLPANLLALSETVQTRRPNLLDLIGLGRRNKLIGLATGQQDKAQMWQPWRELRLQMSGRTLNGAQPSVGVRAQQKLVIPMERGSIGQASIQLLTEDIGLVSYVQELINTLGLLEGEQVEEMSMRIGAGIGSNIMMGSNAAEQQDIGVINSLRRQRTSQRSNINQGGDYGSQGMYDDYQGQRSTNNDDEISGIYQQRQRQQQQRQQNRRQGQQDIGSAAENLPSTDIDNARLLHINRRRLNSALNQDSSQIIGGANEQNRFMNIVRGAQLSQRMQDNDNEDIDNNNDDDDDDDNSFNMNSILGLGMRRSQKQQFRNRQQQQQQQQSISNIFEQNQALPTTSVDDERLLHINRRRLPESAIEANAQTRGRRIPAIQDGRRVVAVQRDDEGISSEELQSVLRQNRRDLSDDEINHLVQLINDRRQRRINLGQLGAASGVSNLPSTDINNERLLHINRRHMINNNNNDNDDDEDNREDIEQATAADIRRGNKINRQGRIIAEQEADMQDNRQRVQGRRVARSLSRMQTELSGSNNDRSDVRKQRIVEVLLHNLQQLVARINLELIAVGQQGSNLGNIINEQSSSEARRLGQVIRQQLDQLLLQQGAGGMQDQEIIDRVIGNVVAGRLGNVGLLDIIRKVVQQTTPNSDQSTIALQLSNPAVLRVLNSVVRIIDQIRQEQLGGYTQQELALEEVTINDVRVDKLATYIDESDMDLINLLNPSLSGDLESNQRMQKLVVARQQRLNNENFNIDLDISAQSSQRVIVRTLLGPKTDALGRAVSLNERRQNFIVLDTFIADLRTGRNRIARNSRDISWTARDTTPYTEIYQRVMAGIRGNIATAAPAIANGVVGATAGQTGRLPARLLLPRGRANGLPMQLLVIVTPAAQNVDMQQDAQTIDNQLIGMGIGMQNIDQLPLGFPLDRKISNERQLIDLPNVKLQDVSIYQQN